jgi:hypothetical protein
MCSADTSPVIPASQVFRDPPNGLKIVALSLDAILYLCSAIGQSMKLKHIYAEINAKISDWYWSFRALLVRQLQLKGPRTRGLKKPARVGMTRDI